MLTHQESKNWLKVSVMEAGVTLMVVGLLTSALIMVVTTGGSLGFLGISWIWLPLGTMFCAVGVSIVRMSWQA
ncbi:hypothetical protein [Yaniella halotolerans]|uniref:hypothetical protein n=1 Tax=Yaniella halotolerans TaxID=225453 RepID=UPI0003B3EFC7|nr:hypothetical protein [Yaniella halotolerans]